MVPKGKLLIIGGSESKSKHYEILGELMPIHPGKENIIEVVTSASQDPEEMNQEYRKIFKKIGFHNIHHINIRTREEAKSEIYIERIKKAHAVIFSGGDQFRLATLLGGTELIETINRKYHEDKDFIIAGTSSGAMVMPKVMIYSGKSNKTLLKGDLKIASGFGLIDYCIIDTHFLERARFGRLAQAILMSPSCTGIGLGEDTALIIKKGNEAECRGSGMVIIIDGRNVKHTNIAYVANETPINVENLSVHILSEGDGYFIKEREFIISKKELRFEKSVH